MKTDTLISNTIYNKLFTIKKINNSKFTIVKEDVDHVSDILFSLKLDAILQSSDLDKYKEFLPSIHLTKLFDYFIKSRGTFVLLDVDDFTCVCSTYNDISKLLNEYTTQNLKNAHLAKLDRLFIKDLIELYISYGKITGDTNNEHNHGCPDIESFINYTHNYHRKIVNSFNLDNLIYIVNARKIDGSEFMYIEQYKSMFRNISFILLQDLDLDFKIISTNTNMQDTILVDAQTAEYASNNFNIEYNIHSKYTIMPTSINIYKNVLLYR